MSWARFFRRKYWDRERAGEIEDYLARETSDNVARGMDPEEARHAAWRKLGNPVQIREEIYQMNSIGFVETIWRDLRYAARLLRMNPGFATVAVLSLGMGIGANTAIFQLLDAVRLRTLPVKSPQELAEIKIADRTWASGNFSSRHPELTNAQWELIRSRQQGFSDTFAWSQDSFNLALGGEARFAHAIWASGDFFRTLGIAPIRGRVFGAADDQRGCGPGGVVISYAFWQREFGGEESAIGRKITLDGHPFQVIGVTPAGFFGMEVGQTFDVILPVCAEAVVHTENSRLDKRHAWWLAVNGRLKPGWTLERATAQLRAISTGVFESTIPPNYTPDEVKKYLAYRLGALPAGTGVSSLRRDYNRPLWLLLAIAGLVLLIACANLANLILARASARAREIVIRLAIGASRGRLIGQLLAESLLLAGAGAVCGIVLAQYLSRFLVSFLSTEGSALFVDLETDWRVLGFTAVLAVLTCVLFGLAPAVRATRTTPSAALRTSGRGLTADSGRLGFRRVLVISQVAMSLVLMVGALLFVRSLRNLTSVETGFRQEGVLIAEIDFTRLNLPRPQRPAFINDVIERVQAIPGVAATADTNVVPISGNSWNESLFLDGPNRNQPRLAWFARITPGYFRTLVTPLVAGRNFDERDTLTSPKVAIVNETFCRKYLNGASPLGKTFRIEVGPNEPQPLYQIVGMVKDTKYGDLREDFKAITYVPATQNEEPPEDMQVLVRSDAPLATLTAGVKRALAEVNPGISVTFHVLKTQIRESLLRERLMATLSGLFGALAALLATVGLYGVISYMVAQRRNEIGIRMALGAAAPAVVRMILREAGVLLACGLAAGSALGLAATRTAEAMLYGLKPYDLSTFAAGILLLALVALLASLLPAWRAARLDPMTALRNE